MKKIFCLLFLFFVFPSSVKAAVTNSSSYTLTDNVGWKKSVVTATTVTETYSYDATADTVSITYVFNGGNFLPLPPMLALAKKYGYPMTFNKTVTESAGNASIFGPLMGVTNDGTNSYKVSFTGLSKYVNNKRVATKTGGTALQAELDAEVTKVINAGHLDPALFLTLAPGALSGGAHDRGMMYWIYPGDYLYFLSEMAPVVSSSVKTNLINYIKTERAAYPPETRKVLPFYGHSSRYAFPQVIHSDDGYSTLEWWYNGMDSYEPYIKFRTQGTTPKFWSLYGLAKYYEATGETPTQTVINNANTITETEFNSYRDWATMYWQTGHVPEYNAAHAVNQLFAGSVGYLRLLRSISIGTTQENFAWGQLAKMAALRFAMGKYTQFDWDRGNRPIGYSSSNPSWWADYRATSTADRGWLAWQGEMVTWDWTKGIDNVRQVHRLDDTRVDLWDYYSWGSQTDGQDKYIPGADDSGWFGWLTSGEYFFAWADITPELGLFFKDHLKPEVQAFIKRVKENQPHWYMAYPEAILGRENGHMLPIDAYDLYMLHAYTLDESSVNLEKLIDYPALQRGDFFYMNKLAEAVKSNQGYTWQTGGTVHRVGIGDFRNALTNFIVAYNLFDMNSIISNYAK